MSVLSVQNLQETLVGKNISRTATQVTNPNAAGYIADGEVVVVNSAGVVYDASSMSYASSPWIQIVQRTGDNLVWSSKIYGNKVTGYRGKAFTFGQEQIYHIGFNGSSNSLDVTAGLDFQLTVIENQDDMMWSEQKKKNVLYVTNNTVTSQLDLAKAIVKAQMKKYVTDGSSITAAMLNSADAAASASQGQTLQVVHGSNLIVYNGVPTVAPAAGALLRIGSTGSGDGATVPVYTVTGAGPASIANSFYIDQPFAGPSNSILPAADHGYIATPGPAYGVRFTGKQLPFRRDFFKFKRVAFTLQMSGFGATPLSKTQEAAYGSGDGRLILEEESFSKGFEGALNRMTVPLPIANEVFTADGSVSSTQGPTAAATSTTGAGSVVSSGAFATITTTLAHNFVVGQSVTITTATPAGFNGTYQIVAVPSTTTFTIANATAGPITVAATITPVYTQNNGDIFPTSAVNYSVITIEHFGQDAATVVQPPAMPQMIKIAIPAGAPQASGGTTTTLQVQLNDWMNNTPGAFPNLTVM